MPKVHRSPLSDQDMDVLQDIAAIANAHTRSNGYAPMYVAIDVGDVSHPDGWLLVCWPAHNDTSAHCARLIFDYIADLGRAKLGAVMRLTDPQETPDGPNR